ncbi:MAG: substrate-binding domain-containing protein, partial [Oscillospiraceae bacterium]
MKINSKKVLFLLMAVIFAFGFSSCSKKTEYDSTIRVAVLVYKGNDTFISNMYESIVECANAYVGENGERLYLSYSDAQDSQATQNEQIERYISLDYDVLCVNLVDRTEAASVIDLAREANIPVVFFNREPVKEDMLKWDRIVYIGTDARQNAELEGQIVVEAYNADKSSIDLDGDGIVRYIMIEGERRHQDTLIRTEVSVQYLKDNGFVLEK